MLDLSQGVVLALLGFGVRGVFGIRDELRRMNGRVRDLEIWSREYEKHIGERLNITDKDIERIDRSVGRPRG
jgi:hypothetical protein